jgi:hypothetical protein
MSSTNADNTLTSAEVAHLNKLEAIVQRGLDTDLELGNALAEINDASLYRGNHQTFEAYLRDRWEIRRSPDDQLNQAAEIADPPSSGLKGPGPGTEPEPRAAAPVRARGRDWLANVREQARHAFGCDGVLAVDIRVTVHRREQPAELAPEPRPTLGPPVDVEAGQLLARLSSLLTHASGKIADVADHLETRAADLDDDAREQLRDDVLALDEELATLTALLEPVDWDAEHGRLLAGEIPPFQDDADDEQDE